MDVTGLSAPILSSSASSAPRDLEQACRALEQEFATLVFRKMREAMVPRSTSGAAGFARDTAEGMLDAQWAQLAGQGEGLGLWRTLCQQLTADAVKSSHPGADESSKGVLQPEEAKSHVDSQRSTGAPLSRLGHSQAGGASAAHQRLHGLPEEAILGASSAGSADRKGK